MVEKKCSIMHKFGPFILDKNKNTATRTCFCCNETITYNNIGEDIKEAIKRQDDVNFFKDFIVYKKYNDDSDKFIQLIRYILEDIDYLYINDETQNKLLSNLSYYNKLLNENDEKKYKLIEDVKKYLKLYFTKNKYEYKFGFDSFSSEDTDKIDNISNSINKQIGEIIHKKNHLSK